MSAQAMKLASVFGLPVRTSSGSEVPSTANSSNVPPPLKVTDTKALFCDLSCREFTGPFQEPRLMGGAPVGALYETSWYTRRSELRSVMFSRAQVFGGSGTGLPPTTRLAAVLKVHAPPEHCAVT